MHLLTLIRLVKIYLSLTWDSIETLIDPRPTTDKNDREIIATQLLNWILMGSIFTSSVILSFVIGEKVLPDSL